MTMAHSEMSITHSGMTMAHSGMTMAHSGMTLDGKLIGHFLLPLEGLTKNIVMLNLFQHLHYIQVYRFRNEFGMTMAHSGMTMAHSGMTFSILAVPHAGVKTVFVKQVLMPSAFYKFSFIEDKNPVAVFYGGKAMGHDYCCRSFRQIVNRSHD